MSDYDEITNLIAAYGHIYDDGRLEEWTELFKYGSYSFFGKEFRGQELMDWIVPVSIRGAARHVNFNIVPGSRHVFSEAVKSGALPALHEGGATWFPASTGANPRAYSNWPDYAPDGRPRSSTVVIRRKDGGIIGT